VLEYMRRYSPYDMLQNNKRYPPLILSGALSDRQVMFHEPASNWSFHLFLFVVKFVLFSVC
jgi:protease II